MTRLWNPLFLLGRLTANKSLFPSWIVFAYCYVESCLDVLILAPIVYSFVNMSFVDPSVSACLLSLLLLIVRIDLAKSSTWAATKPDRHTFALQYSRWNSDATISISNKSPQLATQLYALDSLAHRLPQRTIGSPGSWSCQWLYRGQELFVPLHWIRTLFVTTF